MKACSHINVTSHGQGWVCCRCGTPILSLVLPIPLPIPQTPAGADHA